MELTTSIEFGAIIAAGITAAGSILGLLYKQTIKEKEQYRDPFNKWCMEAYGTIHEFKEICDEITKNNKACDDKIKVSKYSRNEHIENIKNPIFVISHLWEMHREVEKGYKWLGQIDKQDKCAGMAFNYLFDSVDTLWHTLEKDHDEFLFPQITSDDFKKILGQIRQKSKDKTISKFIQDEIEKKQFTCIPQQLKDANHCFDNLDVLTQVQAFLRDKIP